MDLHEPEAIHSSWKKCPDTKVVKDCLQGWVFCSVGIYTQTQRNVHHDCPQRSAPLQIVHTRSGHSLGAITAISSKLPRPWSPSTHTLRKGVAHHMKHPVEHRRSTCEARGHAAQVQVSAAGQWQHACSSTAAPVAHGATITPTYGA